MLKTRRRRPASHGASRTAPSICPGPRAREATGKTYLATLPSIAQARRQLTAWLQSAGADELMVADVAVAVSEACTNAVVHAYRDQPADGHLPLFRVAARRMGDAVTVTVADTGCGMKPRADSPGAGLGLPLIAALSDHVDFRSDPHDGGTVVAMSFTRAGAHARTSCGIPATG